jgi:urease accessory protein
MGRLVLLFPISILVFSSEPLAHSVSGGAYGFAEGIAHPFNGLDHILVMLAAGLWSALSGRPAILIWLLAFMCASAADLAADAAGLCVHFAEPVIASSIILLGLLVIFAADTHLWLGASIMGLLAFINSHDYAACSANSESVSYLAGFYTSLGVLYGAGVALGFLPSSTGRLKRLIIYVFGVLTMVGGMALLVGAAQPALCLLEF